MKKRLMVAAFCLAAAQLMAAGFQPKAVPGTARWVVHADLELLKKTKVGEYLTSYLQAGEAGNKMAALAAILQFDPRKDLTGVTLYGESNEPAKSVAVFNGTFNMNQLVTLLKANPSYTFEVHGTTTIHSWIDEKKPDQRMYGCSHSGRLLISQGLPMLQQAVDVLEGQKPSLESASPFGELPVKEPFFMAGSDLPGLGGQAQAQILSQARSANLAIGEKDGLVSLSLAMSAADAETAVKLQQIAQGLLAMGQLNRDKEPELADFLGSAVVSLDGAQVKVNAAYPAEGVVALLKQKMGK